VDTVRDFSVYEDVLRFDAFSPGLTRQQCLARLSLTLEGRDTLLVLADASGEALQTVRLQDVNLLRNEQGVTESAEDALQRLNNRGVVQLSHEALVQENTPIAPLVDGQGSYQVQSADAFHPDLTGSEKRDALNGDDFDNRLDGAGGADLLRGFAGDDLLDGGPGSDILEGGDGNDTFFWGGKGLMQGDSDSVRDFDPHQDQLVLNISSLYATAGVKGTSLSMSTHGDHQWLQLFDSEKNILLQTIVLENTSHWLGEHGYNLSSDEALHKMLDVGALQLN
jgi:hypothetical protein